MVPPSPPGNLQYSTIDDQSGRGAAYGATARREVSVSLCADTVDTDENGVIRCPICCSTRIWPCRTDVADLEYVVVLPGTSPCRNVVVADRDSCSSDAHVFPAAQSSSLAKRIRRDEWEAAGIFTDSSNDAIDAYDKIIGWTSPRGYRRRSLHHPHDQPPSCTQPLVIWLRPYPSKSKNNLRTIPYRFRAGGNYRPW